MDPPGQIKIMMDGKPIEVSDTVAKIVRWLLTEVAQVAVEPDVNWKAVINCKGGEDTPRTVLEKYKDLK
jgi:hypothetical protein